MPTLLVLCSQCQTERYRSARDMADGEPLAPADLLPLNGQPPAAPGQPKTCSACGGALAVVPASPRQASLPATNGHAPAAPASSDPAVRILFAAQPGEEVKSIRDLPNDKMLITTTKRVVVLDIEAIVIKELPHAQA